MNLFRSSVPNVFGNQEAQHLDLIKQMLLTSLQDNSSYDVRFAAVKASCNFLLQHERENTVLKHFSELLLPILTVR